MKGVTRIALLVIGVGCVLLCLYGCEAKLRAKFAPLGPLPPGAVTKQPDEIVVMSGVPLAGDQYIELGYITVDESRVSPILTEFTSKEDIINMVRKKAAESGADAVIKFSILGEHPARKAEGIAIMYEKATQ